MQAKETGNENQETIAIDQDTQALLKNLNQILGETKAKIELILKVYLNAHGIKNGEYQVTPYFDALILNKTELES
ncbi:MAG: hypothetical protein DWB56_06670 [Candidatus Jettenia sp.]|uniref:Uncharacterized protein n=1 Tax=Candidatus Jettenia caeni TaxID=247490 RepID=I3IN22_9BACT|nr:hypothetical protein [Candidatus Jettenia sp. AMX1]MBC6928636.1 hypothetical protein [Candidatus Jettenia sp.]GAB63117.1 hypothetical protein KSU1_C1521 [Candidatus Jettenia caeni]KAA0250614.1 MAG: hypothetical protein EDM77_03610 [Candidatus Jettenia sp. AMX1]MCE7879948.1 hypothetical protein [Candidatus Jettenia sp. AMX1]MCQ3926730.1 hypothetical protein [Candidatus Jettenia sp.]